MKRFFIFMLAALSVIACAPNYDDTAIWDELKDHEQRITALETLCNKLNTNIVSLQTIVNAQQNNDYVTSVTPLMENGVEIGYTITFSKSGPVIIYHGNDGADGKDGSNGKDGTDGTDGKDGKDGVDGHSPVIGVRADDDGVYYWTLDGEWMLDEEGNKIPATGPQGPQGPQGVPGQGSDNGNGGAGGNDGTDGKDGITPQLKIEEGYWYVSYDNGVSWNRLYKAVGEDGKDGKDGADGAPGQDGADGKDGKDGDSFFQSVDSSNQDYILITLTDGTQIKLPTWKTYEDMMVLVNQINNNVIALQKLVEALEDNDYVTSTTPVMENGKIVGYTINFLKSDSITIYHGKDGSNVPGGESPEIGVRKDTDGNYYWTLNGEWMTDSEGNKVPAAGKNGIDGSNGIDGVDGTDGITPLLMIEGGYWCVSYDNGGSWQKLGKATGENGDDGADGEDGIDGKDGDSFFQDVTEDTKYVYFTMSDGTCLVVPKHIELNIEFDKSNLTDVTVNSEVRIGYYVTSNSPSVDIEVMPSNDLRAFAIADDASNKTGEILIRTGSAFDSASKVLVFVNDGNKVIMKSITVTIIEESETAQLHVYNGDTKNVPSAGGAVTLAFLTNVECKASIPAEAKSWISVVNTKALDLKNVQLNIAENTSERRSAVVKVESLDGKLSVEYTIIQAGSRSSNTPSLGSNGTLAGTPAANEIFYLSSDGNIVPTNPTKFDATMISNTHDNGVGVIVFDKQVTTVAGFGGAEMQRFERNLKEIIMPVGVKEVGIQAFMSCRELESIHIPPTVISIKYRALEGCTNLKAFHISDLSAWCDLGLDTSFNGFPVDIRWDMYLNGELLTEVKIPDGVTSVGNFICNKSITKVIIPDGVTEIRDIAFNRCTNLTDISLPESLNIIGAAAFLLCTDLVNITLPESLTVIGLNAFSECQSLKEINIPDKITKLESGTFSGCTSLEKITFGKGFNTYSNKDNEVFKNTLSLNEIYFKSPTPPTYDSGTNSPLFGTLGDNAKIYVPAANLDAYKAAPALSNHADKIVGY
jgi:hypothetical protein